MNKKGCLYKSISVNEKSNADYLFCCTLFFRGGFIFRNTLLTGNSFYREFHKSGGPFQLHQFFLKEWYQVTLSVIIVNPK